MTDPNINLILNNPNVRQTAVNGERWRVVDNNFELLPNMYYVSDYGRLSSWEEHE